MNQAINQVPEYDLYYVEPMVKWLMARFGDTILDLTKEIPHSVDPFAMLGLSFSTEIPRTVTVDTPAKFHIPLAVVNWFDGKDSIRLFRMEATVDRAAGTASAQWFCNGPSDENAGPVTFDDVMLVIRAAKKSIHPANLEV